MAIFPVLSHWVLMFQFRWFASLRVCSHVNDFYARNEILTAILLQQDPDMTLDVYRGRKTTKQIFNRTIGINSFKKLFQKPIAVL